MGCVIQPKPYYLIDWFTRNGYVVLPGEEVKPAHSTILTTNPPAWRVTSLLTSASSSSGSWHKHQYTLVHRVQCSIVTSTHNWALRYVRVFWHHLLLANNYLFYILLILITDKGYIISKRIKPVFLNVVDNNRSNTRP